MVRAKPVRQGIYILSDSCLYPMCLMEIREPFVDCEDLISARCGLG